MARKYVARNPRTGKSIRHSGAKSRRGGVSALTPEPGPWQNVEYSDIVPLANGESGKIQVSTDLGFLTLGRIDGIKALHKVLEKDASAAYEALVDALEDNYPDVRIAALKSLPSFALRRQGILFQCLSDRLLDDEEAVRSEARRCLIRVSPMFPSGCEVTLRRELRDSRKEHRDGAFEALRLSAREWTEVGCLHIDELIREEEVDLRIRASALLRTIARKGGAEVWDLISWSMQDEEVRVRRNASRTLTILADSEPRIAAILVESSIEERDSGIRNHVIKALKKLDMQSPKVVQMIIRGARDKDVSMRGACIGQLAVILSGQELRETADELLRKEVDPELKRKLSALARDPDLDGTEEEKNRSLAPLDKVHSEDISDIKDMQTSFREDDKRQSGRPATRKADD